MTQETAALTEQTIREWSQALAEPDWLLSRRLDAWRTFEAMSMPTGFEEEWRRTDISGFDLAAALAASVPGAAPARSSAGPSDRESLSGLLVQQDADVVERYLDPALEGKVLLMDLDTAAREHADLVQEHLHSLVLPGDWKLQALQAALWSGGALVYVPPGVEVELPLRYSINGLQAGRSLFPHLLIVADEDSAVTVVQEAASDDGEGQSFVSGAVEVIARPNARVRYFDIQRWGLNAWNFSTVRARLDEGAQFVQAMVGLGGRLTRSKVDVILQGEGSQADLIGVSYGDGEQHFDYNTLQDHLAPRTTSDLLYKAALEGRASEVWYGLVRIHKGASQSDANQTSRNLLLSDTAKAAPIPVLEIEAYDILRCSHGATAGPVDEDQLFYLESRGIHRDDAERLLVEAFFQQVFDRIPDERVRERVQNALAAKVGRS